jgi:hypothetical protein
MKEPQHFGNQELKEVALKFSTNKKQRLFTLHERTELLPFLPLPGANELNPTREFWFWPV